MRNFAVASIMSPRESDNYVHSVCYGPAVVLGEVDVGTSLHAEVCVDFNQQGLNGVHVQGGVAGSVDGLGVSVTLSTADLGTFSVGVGPAVSVGNGVFGGSASASLPSFGGFQFNFYSGMLPYDGQTFTFSSPAGALTYQMTATDSSLPQPHVSNTSGAFHDFIDHHSHGFEYAGPDHIGPDSHYFDHSHNVA